jgi:hypothetical protein
VAEIPNAPFRSKEFFGSAGSALAASGGRRGIVARRRNRQLK